MGYSPGEMRREMNREGSGEKNKGWSTKGVGVSSLTDYFVKVI